MIPMSVPYDASGGVNPRRPARRDQPGGTQVSQPSSRWVRYAYGAVLAGFLVLGLLAGSLVAGDDLVPDQPEPPVRLKKKARPQPEAAKDQRPEPPTKKEPIPKDTEPPPSGEPKDDADRNLQDVEEKIRELTNRLSKNMSQAEERLHKSDAGQGTQQTQRDILRDLDELIAQTMRQQQQQQQQQQQSSSSSGSQDQRERQAQRSRMQQREATGKRSLSSRNRPEKTQDGNNPRGGKTTEEGASKIADLYKDIWGHLPESLRQEMDQYSREQFMAKYGDLLKQYYATIAEKGRRKGEE